MGHNKMQISVMMANGKSLVLEVSEDDTLKEIQAKIAEEAGNVRYSSKATLDFGAEAPVVEDQEQNNSNVVPKKRIIEAKPLPPLPPSRAEKRCEVHKFREDGPLG